MIRPPNRQMLITQSVPALHMPKRSITHRTPWPTRGLAGLAKACRLSLFRDRNADSGALDRGSRTRPGLQAAATYRMADSM